MRSNSSSVMSKNGVAELMPAPLTTMSTRPLRLQHGVEQALELGLAGGLGGVKPGLAAGRGDLVEAGLGLVGVAADDHDLGARAGEALGHGAAEFAGAADDDGHLAFEAKIGFQIFFRFHERDGTNKICLPRFAGLASTLRINKGGSDRQIETLEFVHRKAGDQARSVFVEVGVVGFALGQSRMLARGVDHKEFLRCLRPELRDQGPGGASMSSNGTFSSAATARTAVEVGAMRYPAARPSALQLRRTTGVASTGCAPRSRTSRNITAEIGRKFRGRIGEARRVVLLRVVVAELDDHPVARLELGEHVLPVAEDRGMISCCDR